MELFKTTCVTCRARLSVRDHALIGQIVACPRCGSMVQIEAPAGVSAQPAAAAIAAPAVVAAVAAPALDSTINASLSNVSPRPTSRPPEPVAADPTFATSTFEDAAAAVDDVATPGPPAPLAGGPGAPPAASAASSGWSALRLAMLILGGVGAGSLLVAVTMALLGGDDSPASGPAASTPSTPADAPAPAVAAVEPRPVPGDKLPASDPLAAASVTATEPPPPAESTAAAETALEEVTAAPAPAAHDPPPPAPGAAATAASVAPAGAPPGDLPPPTADVERAPRLRIDPLDVDPEGLSLATLRSGLPSGPPVESQLPVEGQPPPSVPDEPAAAPDPSLLPPVAAPIVRRDAGAGVGAPQNPEAVLARKLPAIEVDKAPLCRLLDQAVQVTGLPVSVAPHELRMARISAAAPVSAAATESTIVEFLARSLAPLRLAPMVQDGQIRLTYATQDKRRTISYAVDDLAASPADVQRLADWLQRLIAPHTWQDEQSPGRIAIEGSTLQIEQRESVQYEIVILLERYRLARGLPPRSKYPAALLDANAACLELWDRLQAPATFTFTDYTEIREIFRFWQEELGIVVLVDWPALADERLWPQARIACSVAGKAWADSLDSVLEPLGLGWRAVDRRTIEITSLAKVREEPQTDLYRDVLPSGDGEPPAVDRINDLVSKSSSASEPAAISQYDPAAKVLIVRQSGAAHRRLAAILRDSGPSAPQEAPPGGPPAE